MKTPARHPKKPSLPGFTLTEILVVLTIIVVLAALTMTITSKIRRSAAAAKSINQMRQISVAVATHTADNGMLDFFYVSSPVADYWNENGNGAKYTPGNPARALYNAQSPESGIVQDHLMFFSPLVDIDPPDKSEYDPTKANSKNPWGTYAWFYPFIADATKMEGPQKAYAKLVTSESVNPRIEGKYMMSESYPSISGPKFGKKIYHALLNDGSIQYVADSLAEYERWRRGN